MPDLGEPFSYKMANIGYKEDLLPVTKARSAETRGREWIS
jgi:hypothetical protein